MSFVLKDADALSEGAKSLRAGDRAKLVFLGPLKASAGPPRDAATGRPLPWRFGGERMWVQVDEVSVVGEYEGSLRSRPLAIDGAPGDRVTFSAGHVLEFRRAS